MMTREEAIKYGENKLTLLRALGYNNYYAPGEYIGYYDEFSFVTAALSALRPITREQVEKVWRGEWVKRHRHRGGLRRVKGFDDMGEQHEITIDERCEYNDLYCPKCGRQSPDNFLNFCGYCGAPMTDEAVDMVMERLEALYGQENT